MTPPLIIAHRTCPPYAPENSLEGIRVAVAQGADGAEIDLRMSLDMRPFLLHDNSMRRTTGWPLPIELTPSLLVRKQRLLLQASDEQRSDEPPPTLGQVLDALPEGRTLAVDVKTPWSIFALVPEVRRRRIEKRTLVWCSSGMVAKYAVSRLPGVEVAHYKDFEDGPANLAFIEASRRLGVQAVSLDWRGIDAPVVAAAHAAGLRVYSWHKEFELTAEKLKCGLDGLITDHPERARSVLESI